MNNKKFEKNKLNRSLKSRHVQMIAIGGSIGVGIFLGSARTIQMAGPCVLLGYAILGIVGYIILRSLGEISVEYPISGSFSVYASKFINPVMGYVTGWSYWLLWIFGVMAETTAVGSYMKMWFSDVPSWVWTFVALVLLTLVNLINVKAFGEFEFWFALIKVITILALIVVGLVLIAIAFFTNESDIGFSNLWEHGGFFPMGFWEFVKTLGPVAAGFIGIESLGLTAGEIENPEKVLPSAISKVVVRVCIFYIGSLFVVMSLFSWNNMVSDVSPFVLTFEKIGLKSAAGIINFVVITAALSACNSGIFSSSRMLYTLESQGFAPKILGKLNSKQIPIFAVLFSSFFGLIGVVLSFAFPKEAFDMVLSTASVPGIFIWGVILYTQIRFRKTLTFEETAKLKYKSFLYPYANYFCIVFLAFIVLMFAFTKSYRVAVIVFPAWLLILFIIYRLQIFLKGKTLK